jgi:hypothetical protein
LLEAGLLQETMGLKVQESKENYASKFGPVGAVLEGFAA